VIPTDQLLAQRAAGGDAAAFASLHDRHATAVRRTALGILRDADAAGDVVQATFARVWTALGRGQVPAEPRAWLHAIARNAALDELRARRRVGPAGDATASRRRGPTRPASQAARTSTSRAAS
jgi:RNA polymerase sigma-70 factor (ECF subfamily)